MKQILRQVLRAAPAQSLHSHCIVSHECSIVQPHTLDTKPSNKYLNHPEKRVAAQTIAGPTSTVFVIAETPVGSPQELFHFATHQKNNTGSKHPKKISVDFENKITAYIRKTSSALQTLYCTTSVFTLAKVSLMSPRK